MKKIYCYLTMSMLLVLCSLSSVSFGQGCIAVRPMSCSSAGHINNLNILHKGEFKVSGTYRYFQSFRHFSGDVENKDRITQKTNVINTANSVDLGVGYGITDRLCLNVNLPVSSFDRSSLYEHYGNSTKTNPDQLRFHTQSMGIGDARISGDYWIRNIDNDSLKWNMQIGLGVKAPTGNSDVTDQFHRRTKDGRDSTTTLPVDQSIQLGDGGWGFNTELQAYYRLSSSLALYFNGFYLFNPMTQNKTLTKGTATGDPNTMYHSIADQFGVRLGASFVLVPKKGITVSLGARAEGIPAHDIIGSSKGFRRPGYIVSADPGVSCFYHKFTFNLNVPYCLYRNRTRSYADVINGTHGDAAFADYLVNLNVEYHFGKSKAKH